MFSKRFLSRSRYRTVPTRSASSRYFSLQYLVGRVVPCGTTSPSSLFFFLPPDPRGLSFIFCVHCHVIPMCNHTHQHWHFFFLIIFYSFSEHNTTSCKFLSKHSRARPSRLTSSLPILLKTSRPRSRIRKASLLINSVWSLLASSSRTAVRSVTTVRVYFGLCLFVTLSLCSRPLPFSLIVPIFLI